MLPYGPAGRAAADLIANPQRLKPSGGGSGDPSGIISALALLVIVFWIMTFAWDARLDTVVDWVIFLASAVSLQWLAFRTQGWVGGLGGFGFVVLATCAVANGLFGNQSDLAGILGGVATFGAVGADQTRLKRDRNDMLRLAATEAARANRR